MKTVVLSNENGDLRRRKGTVKGRNCSQWSVVSVESRRPPDEVGAREAVPPRGIEGRATRRESAAPWDAASDTTKSQRRNPRYFSTTVIAGVALVLLMKTSLLPEMRMAVVPVPKVPVPFGGTE
jgi:hypothetical protein